MEETFEKVKTLIYNFQPLEEEEWQAFAEHLVFKQYSKGDFLVREGERANTIYYIESGITRSYFIHNSKEFTIDFHFGGEFVSPFYAIITGQPSITSVEVLQDVNVVELPYSKIAEGYKNSVRINNVGRKIAEMHYINRLQKEMDLISLTAEERYAKLMEKHPALVSVISVKHLSSYLGIHPESLSRIRKLYIKN